MKPLVLKGHSMPITELKFNIIYYLIFNKNIILFLSIKNEAISPQRSF